MTVLVTGASGFVGRRLHRFLVKKNIPVRVVLREKDITFEEAVFCDFEKEALSFEVFHDVETVFHLAGCTHDINSKRNIDIYRKINTETTTKIAEMAGENKVKNFVFVSSVKAGGSPTQGKIISETDQGKPEGIYGATKRDAELKLLDIGSQSKMHISIVRPTLVYGKNDPHNGYGPNQFIRLAQSKKDISLFGKGEEKRDHIHVNDVGNAIYFLVNKKYVGTVNLVSGTVNSFFKIAQKIKDLYKVKIKYVKRKGPMPHNGYRAFNNYLLKKILPKTNNPINIFEWINKKEKYKRK